MNKTDWTVIFYHFVINQVQTILKKIKYQYILWLFSFFHSVSGILALSQDLWLGVKSKHRLELFFSVNFITQ